SWALNQRVDAVLTRLGLDGDADIGQLSGGLKRRVMLARALVSEPDLLLLDEPTNHLDIDAITWIEEFLLGWSGSLLFITHDRAFLQRLATRIIELDRGRLYDFPCDYANYLIRKEELLANEEKENALFDKKLAQEEVWVRQGIKARRTRNEGRVTALKKMRAEFAARRNLTGTATINVQDAQRSGHLVAEAENVCFAHGEKTIIKNFSTTILRGDKIGIIGPNGAGKTTLLNLLLGKSAPTSGTLRLGTNMQIAYFDQYRAQLDEEKSVQDNVGEGADFIVLNGQRKHIMSYLQDFLFSPARVRQPVKALSGGERNRLLLAKLFTKPANVLVLDEPTNDLDSDTLELLEERLVEYSGTLLLVSHDRAFLNNVVTSTLVFEGGGVINEYVGGYDDWLRQRRVAAAPATSQKNMTNAAPTTPAEPKAKVKKRSYKDQRELDELPAKIEALDAEKAALTAQMNMPEFYRQDKNAIAVTQQRLADIELALAQAYARWEALE
ncbi:MAG: ATP-binding cassette domain-containing protein, partial [Gammaproteobacteria bacterium]|nr:ATP-binding cassette domain-containing protein [Gammaproteobacteria bacterium]